MSNTTKSAKAQKNNIKAYASGFYFLALACIEASREDGINEYYKRAGVPKANASTKVKKAWLSEHLSPAMPQLFDGAKWKGAILSTRKKDAFVFLESSDVLTNCKGINGVQVELGSRADKDGAKKNAFLFVECSKRVAVVKIDHGAAGKEYETTEDGKRKYETKKYAKYIALRKTDKDGRELYTLEEIINTFYFVLGIPQAIANEIAARAELKAAKTIAAAEQAKAAAAATAERAKEQAQKAVERAKAKADAAKAEQTAQGMTAAKAFEIVNEDEKKRAAEKAEKAEGKSRAKGEGIRKKSNTQTKASKQIKTK